MRLRWPLWAALALCSAMAAAAEPDAAAALVERMKLGEGFAELAYEVAAKTQTYRALAQSAGLRRAQDAVREELERALPKYQPRWDRNLADAYAETFTREELDSLAEKQNASPYFDKFQVRQSQVGRSMQAKSNALLRDLVSEALKNASSRLTPPK